MGSRHYQLGHKLALLDAAVKRNGPIDCIMLGSSMVDVGFNPESFQHAYRQATGREIHCFNFGIDASSAASAAALARILIEDYHPRFIIFGTDPRDYAIPSTDRDPAAVCMKTRCFMQKSVCQCLCWRLAIALPGTANTQSRTPL